MKRVLLTIAIISATMFCTNATAEGLSFGAKGGVTLNSFKFTDNVQKSFGTDNRSGFFIGPSLKFSTALGFGVDAAILYANDKESYTLEGEGYDGRKHMLEIPVNLRWEFNLIKVLGLYVAAGPDFTFDFKGKDNGLTQFIEDNYNGGGYEVNDESKGYAIGINVGTGIILFSHLEIGINYIIPLQNDTKFTVDGIGDIMSSKERRLQISAQYFF